MFWPVGPRGDQAPSRTRRSDAQPQAERYWRALRAGRSYPAVRYVVLCSFQRLLIWTCIRIRLDRPRPRPQRAPDTTRRLASFSAPPGGVVHRAPPRAHARRKPHGFHALPVVEDRDAAPPEVLTRFIMQCVWTLFAEDLQMLRDYPLQTIVSRLQHEGASNSARDISWLFRVLNQKRRRTALGELSGTRTSTASCSPESAAVHLPPWSRLLLRGCGSTARRPDDLRLPHRGVLGRDQRWEIGAHYTHEVDILKIVEPDHRPALRSHRRQPLASAGSRVARRAVCRSRCSTLPPVRQLPVRRLPRAACARRPSSRVSAPCLKSQVCHSPASPAFSH